MLFKILFSLYYLGCYFRMDLQKNRKFHKGERPKIELGAVLDTNCKKCGGHGNSQIPVQYSSNKRPCKIKCCVFINIFF